MLRSLIIFAALAASFPAHALDVFNDYGGRVEPYAARAMAADRAGEPVRIAGECDSSCTLYLGSRTACVYPGAVLGFHAPWVGSQTRGVVDPKMTALFASAYNGPLRRVFLDHVRRSHGVVPGPLLRITGAQLAGMGYRLCR